ncbi:hypothetical protein U0070_019666, partial [Myodes glareolus]
MKRILGDRTGVPMASCSHFVPPLHVSLTDAHILSCSFTVNSGSRCIESKQCSVDGVSLHSYDNDNTRKEGNAPKECANLFSKLEDIGGELWNQLHIMEEKGDLTRGNHSLLVTAVSQYTEGQPINGYWNFTLDGHHSFSFDSLDSKNKKYALTHNNIPGIDKWQSNTDLAKDLETFSIGDSDICFQEILSQSKKMARSTSRTPDIGNVKSPTQLPSTMNTTQLPSTMNTTQLPSTTNTAQLPSPKQPPSKGGSSVTAVVIPIVIVIFIIILIVIVLSVIICIYKCVKRRSHPQA